MSIHRQALSTGQAAQHCFVTAETIANWIRRGLLRAQRTAGGQYRILAADLRTFMASRGMNTSSLEEEREESEEATGRQPCWEARAAGSHGEARCDECIVKYLKVLDCFKLMAMRAAEGGPVRDCSDCPYYRRHGGKPSR